MEAKKKTCGRPPGRKKTAKIEVLIEPELKDRFLSMLSEEGKNASSEVYGWIRGYINNHEETDQ